jgi:SPP1 gp7 family putative phage head morphogenesis protein
MAPRSHPESRKLWTAARKTESRYGVSLRKLANTIAHIMGDFPNATIGEVDRLAAMLREYANSSALLGWASAVSSRMLAEVNLKDAKSWEQHSRQMGYALRRELRNAPTGATMRALHDEQVELIQSLPLEAATKAQEAARESLVTGERYETLRDRIQELGPITRNRATLIARTEVSKASTSLTQARAEFIGSPGYIWRTADDYDVRPSHKRMNGRYVLWADAPEVDPGYRYHAGCFPNCRCWPEPVIPDDLS